MREPETTDVVFLAVDGDDVGHRLEYFMLTNETESLECFAIGFQVAMGWFGETLEKKLGARILFSGGDSLLAKLPVEAPLEFLEDLRTTFREKAGSTLSVGIGRSPRQAYIALNFAKASGKNCVRHFEELPNG